MLEIDYPSANSVKRKQLVQSALSIVTNGIIVKELRLLCVSQVHGCYYIIQLSPLGISQYQVS